MALVLCQELIDTIIDYTWDDRDVLINCCLASGLFLPSARRHLFEQITLSYFQWTPFLNLLESPHSTINRIDFITLDFECRSDFQNVLYRIMMRLRGLRTRRLSFSNMQIELPIGSGWEIAGLTSNIKILSLHHPHSTNTLHLFNIFSKFKNLEHLHLFIGRYEHLSPDQNHPVDCKSTVTTIWRTLIRYY